MFSEIHRDRLWASNETVSGRGSELANTEVARRVLPTIIRELDIRSIVDAPCGDYNWMKEVPVELHNYIGIDIVPDLIRRNSERFSREGVTFLCMDLVAERCPRADLIICRDCLIHLSLADGLAVLGNFRRSGSRFLLSTTFPTVQRNRDIRTGDVRPINMEAPPFSLPAPLKLIDEELNDEVGGALGQFLGLWTLDSESTPLPPTQ